MACFCSIQLLPFAKSLTLLSPISTLSSLPLRPIRSNFSPPPVSSLPSPFICRCTSATSPPPHSDGFIGFLDDDEEEAAAAEEEEEEDEEEFYEDDDLDLEALESEAKDAVRSYSTSLSRQLTIEDETDDLKGFKGKQKRRKGATKTIPDHLLPKVTIVGRPNVGKSALFNRLVGGNRAIVVDEPGVTRDRLYGRSFWGDHEFVVVDTGGVLNVSKSQANVMEDLAISTTIGMDGISLLSREAAVARMPSMIEWQATAAVEEASVIIFLVDGQDVENMDKEENYVPSIAIVGRPNVGKSSILNSLLGEDRTIVSPISGTTRDAIDTEFVGPDGQKFRLIDTAGIRRRASVASSGSTTEALSVNRAFRAIRRSDVVALVIEAMACITEQDTRIAERIEKEGKGCLIVVNKWDTIPNKNQQTATYYEQDVREKMRMLDWAPIVYSTAITGQSVEKVIVAASTVEKERARRLSTAILNQVIREAIAFKPPPRTRGGKRGRVYYCTQAAIRPPTFVFFVNDAKLFPETYRRYMEKQLRSDAGFAGTPIRLLWRSRRKVEKDEGKAATRTRSNLSPREGNVALTT
ncbi:hypothetical protein ES332_D08G019700v1 [Gossypium tomentosum]|uniref:GTPase Der n=1 Tax=Gossypium tomentosum TaxID=34277 RepID=A0A5D2JP29_GOSTO|nr:hypothetical protein ES332_D08G019700v1 [Gossypium tomentosum]